MSERTCTACSNPAQQGVEICKRCERRTVYHLADQESHRVELEVALTRMVRMQASNDGGRSTPTHVAWAGMGVRFLDTIKSREIAEFIAKSPPARTAADALHSQRSLLVSWVRLVMDDNPGLPMPADSIASLSGHLSHWMPLLRRHEAAGEFVTELQALVDEIMVVIDTPENRTRILVGPCPETLVEHLENQADREFSCPGQVEAIVPHDEVKRPKMVCRYCKAEWMAEQWLRTGTRILRKQGRTPPLDPEAAREFLARVAS
jgi:hypothetical protein